MLPLTVQFIPIDAFMVKACKAPGTIKALHQYVPVIAVQMLAIRTNTMNGENPIK